jgi:hypothetical protein
MYMTFNVFYDTVHPPSKKTSWAGSWDVIYTQIFLKMWAMSLINCMISFLVRKMFCPRARVGTARGFVRNVACFKTYMLTQFSSVTFLMALGLHDCTESSNGKWVSPDHEWSHFHSWLSVVRRKFFIWHYSTSMNVVINGCVCYSWCILTVSPAIDVEPCCLTLSYLSRLPIIAVSHNEVTRTG